MILLIDNYDSFTYNLYQLIGEFTDDCTVVRNDAIDLDGIEKMQPQAIVLSPGPGRPEDAGICPQVVRNLAGRIPLLGVCLGHQAICQEYGATVGYAKSLMHGKVSPARCSPDSVLFAGLPETVAVARYHSLSADADTLPEGLRATAMTDDGEVMAVEDAARGVYGVQFHPESVMTPDGSTMMANFLRAAGVRF